VQFGINPLYLTDIFLVGSSLQKNFVSKMNVPVDAKWVIDEVLVGDTCFEGNIYPGLKVNYMKILNFTGKKKFPHVSLVYLYD
jgi:hypothetical protein